MITSFSLSRQDTSVLKGIAICAMLFHHMYACPIADDVAPYDGFLNWIGILGKVCVSIFLFCSGYGLSVQYQKTESLFDSVSFVRRRLVKFYLNYWTVFLIFVPITIWVFNRPLTVPYGEHVNVFKRLVLDLLGVQGYQSYNITWWFNRLIIVLYLLFPLIYWLTHRIGIVFSILLGLCIFRLFQYLPGQSLLLGYWQFPFLLGVIWTMLDSNARVRKYLDIPNVNAFLFGVVIVLGVLCVFLRMDYHGTFWWSREKVDPIITVLMALFVLLIQNKRNALFRSFSFLGKHSMNIYMIHTFFNGYWHPEWLHMTGWMRCGINFIVLMSLCLATSLLLEFLKHRLGIYKLSNIIIG